MFDAFYNINIHIASLPFRKSLPKNNNILLQPLLMNVNRSIPEAMTIAPTFSKPRSQPK